MKLRWVYLADGQSLNDSDTVTLNITKGLKILAIRCRYSATNGGTSNTVGRLNGMVSKLAVVDGSQVLHSLSFREEQARNFRVNGYMPYQSLSQAAGDTVTEEAIIDFRRFPGDTSFYLDTANYSNPQLQLTHALTISATAGFATGTGSLSVIALVIDSGAPSRLGFVMAKEIDSFASTSSGDHTTDLPLDFPIAEIMVQDPVDGEGPDHYLPNFKLTADTDSFIPVDMAYTDLLADNLEQFGRAAQDQVVLNGTSGTLKGDVYYATEGIMAAAGATAKGLLTVQAANESTLAMTTGETGSVVGKMVGSAVHATVYFPFGDGISPDQIFSPQGVGKFQLKLTNAATGATPKVVVVQQHS